MTLVWKILAVLGGLVALTHLIWSVSQARWKKRAAMGEAHVPIVRALKHCREAVKLGGAIDSEAAAEFWARVLVVRENEIEQQLKTIVQLTGQSGRKQQGRAKSAYTAFNQALVHARTVMHMETPEDLKNTSDTRIAVLGAERLLVTVECLVQLEKDSR